MKLLQITACLISALLSAVCARFLFPWPFIMWILIIIFIAVAVIFSFICLPFYFANLKCIVTANQVTIRTGVFFRREQSIRLQTVQFVQLITGPFDGAFGLNSIILYVYGGNMMILFLKKQDRQELTQFLERKGVFHAP